MNCYFESEPHTNHQIMKPGSGLIRGSFATNMSSSVTNSFNNDNYDSNRLFLLKLFVKFYKKKT